MTTGIYTYWDNVKNCYVYVGKDSNIDKKARHNAHIAEYNYNKQPINRIIQNNPERYEYRIIMEGNYNEWELNQMEKLCIKSFKTFKEDYPDRNVFNFTKGGDGSLGYKHSEETIKKISESNSGENNPIWKKSQNTSRYYRVSKIKDPQYEKGFRWIYRYYDNGKRKRISSVSLEKLESKVRAKNLPWKKLY